MVCGVHLDDIAPIGAGRFFVRLAMGKLACFNKSMDRPHPALGSLLRAVLVLFGLFSSAPTYANAPSKPNVILILADDFGWKDLAGYGSDFYESPHIDQLARDGMKFTQAYSACTVCSPTRAAILTGKYPAPAAW